MTEPLQPDLASAEAFLLSRAPETDIEPTLERIRAAAHLLGNPEQDFKIIHIAGTNGKTSTARMTEQLLRTWGLRTGMFTSPHLHSSTERIAIDGVPIAGDVFADHVAYLQQLLPLIEPEGERPLSYFELMFAVALLAFSDAPVDVAVIETGLGGSWDATNIVPAQVAVLTPISYDHQAYLGDSLTGIAAEKAGIIKTLDAVQTFDDLLPAEQRHQIQASRDLPAGRQTVVIAPQAPEVEQVLAERIAQTGVRVVRPQVLDQTLAVGGQVLTIDTGLSQPYEQVMLPLHGKYQGMNAALALAAVEALVGRPIPTDVLMDSTVEFRSPGRLEVIGRDPTVIVDAAHNPAGAKALAGALAETFQFVSLVGVVAVSRDKDVAGIVAELAPQLDFFIATRNHADRSMSAEDLAEIAADYVPEERLVVVDTLPEAYVVATELLDSIALQETGSGILFTGSVTTAAQARSLLGTTAITGELVTAAPEIVDDDEAARWWAEQGWNDEAEGFDEDA